MFDETRAHAGELPRLGFGFSCGLVLPSFQASLTVMEWFRWYHGCVNDPKFRLIAKKAGATVAEAVAVWACVLERASESDDRGHPGRLDFDSLDCALQLADGTALRLHVQMTERGMLEPDGRIEAWDRRQPKREDNSTERVRAFRERQKAPETGDETQMKRDVTHGNSRLEERREERKKPPKPPEGGLPDGFADFWSVYPKKASKPSALRAWRKLKPDTQTVQAIIAGVNRDRRSAQWLRDDGQFIPNPATWLNGERWNDGQDVSGVPWYAALGYGSADAARAAGHSEAA